MKHTEAIAHLALAAHGLRTEAAVSTRAAEREPHHRMQHLQAADEYRARAAQIDAAIRLLTTNELKDAA
ncbi:hypothetical protein [Zhihengliuella flava]|uniref:Uncharacterized protein n=1 Tax=Zhihengliuella flava TaxID=1285193 RepID=A0A931GFZ1_9MICC|nr:hypothetical protein [Zhihengliuella flava]MBG6085848.1 hypothetical protein [Zhihengliuella flava]